MKNILNIIKRIFALYLIISVVLFNTAQVAAQEVTPEPTTFSEPTQAVEQPVTPTEAPATPTPTLTTLEQRDADEEFQKRKAEAEAEWEATHGENNQNGASLLSPTPNPTGTQSNGNVGDTVVSTGDATSNGEIVSTGNTNTSSQGIAEVIPGTEGAVITNTENGSASTNTNNASASVSTDTTQNNGAVVSNGMQQSATTGNSTSSLNVGNTQTSTGDANTTGTAITAVNTNVDGIMVSEFNIVDDQVGDIILSPEAFAANCISGCGGTNLANTGNGANSTNNANATTTTDSNTFQNNEASVGNDMVLAANSGNNESNLNTGDTTITTGDANIVANMVNFVNNNVAGGNLIVTVVNVFDEWVGDFITPDQQKLPKNPTTEVAQITSVPTPTVAQLAQANNHGASAPTATPQVNQQTTEAQTSVTPTVATGQQVTYQKKNKVVAFAQNQKTVTTDVEASDDTSDKKMVAGASTTNVQGVSKKVLNINLAWFVIILPLLVVGVIGARLARKRMLARRSLFK